MEKTFDVVFHDSQSSNRKGFSESLEYCQSYIQRHNGTNESYFPDYAGGVVLIVCNEGSDIVEQHNILNK
jgi:hypothetical protein